MPNISPQLSAGHLAENQKLNKKTAANMQSKQIRILTNSNTYDKVQKKKKLVIKFPR